MQQLAPGLLIVDAPLGTPRWAVAPNTFHHLHVGPWIDAGAEAWAPPKAHRQAPRAVLHQGPRS